MWFRVVFSGNGCGCFLHGFVCHRISKHNGGEKMTTRELRQEYDGYLRDKKSAAVNFTDYMVNVVIPRECDAAVDQYKRERICSYINEAVESASQLRNKRSTAVGGNDENL